MLLDDRLQKLIGAQPEPVAMPQPAVQFTLDRTPLLKRVGIFLINSAILGYSCLLRSHLSRLLWLTYLASQCLGRGRNKQKMGEESEGQEIGQAPIKDWSFLPVRS